MIGVVTGLEAITDGLTFDQALGRAASRAFRAYLKAGIDLRFSHYVVRWRQAINQDALIAEMAIDSSTWTGR